MTWLYCAGSFLVGVIVAFCLMWAIIIKPLIEIAGSLVELTNSTVKVNIEQRKIISDYEISIDECGGLL